MITTTTYEVRWRFKHQEEVRPFDNIDEATACFERVGNDPYVEVEIIKYETTKMLYSYRPAKQTKGT